MTMEEINEYAIRYRGLMLNEITNLEKLMDGFLCSYFTSDLDKQDELMEMVFGGLRITFDNKRGIFDHLSKTGKISLEQKYPKLFSEMQNLFSDRKILAHYMVDISEEAKLLPDGTIRFHALNNKHELKVFDKEKMKKIEKQISKMCEVFC